MKGVDTIARIRREFFVRGKTIKEIVRELHVSRNTVRKVLRSGATEFTYEREVQPLPKLGRIRPCRTSSAVHSASLTSVLRPGTALM
jgi:predicted transcriptional regulator